jgi:hypothetical protein
MLRLFTMLSIVSILLPSGSFAQSDISSTFVDTSTSITLSPSVPTPFEPYTATLSDYTSSAYGGSIAWYVDGQRLEAGDNQREITLVAGDKGSVTKLEAVLSSDGAPVSIKTLVKPMYLDIIIEPITHVPTFYTGRPLPSPGSTVFATALINAGALSPSNLVYTWRLNDSVLGGGSLRGQYKTSFEMPQDSESVLSLHISDLKGEVIAKKAVVIPLTMPRLVFYEVSALYGLTQQKIESPFFLIGNSTTVRAEPFHLSSDVFNNPSVIEWKINSDKVLGDAGNPYNLTLQRTGEGGQARIQFHVRSTTEFLQGAQDSFEIQI